MYTSQDTGLRTPRHLYFTRPSKVVTKSKPDSRHASVCASWSHAANQGYKPLMLRLMAWLPGCRSSIQVQDVQDRPGKLKWRQYTILNILSLVKYKLDLMQHVHIHRIYIHILFRILPVLGFESIQQVCLDWSWDNWVVQRIRSWQIKHTWLVFPGVLMLLS